MIKTCTYTMLLYVYLIINVHEIFIRTQMKNTLVMLVSCIMIIIIIYRVYIKVDNFELDF